jgi:LPXTG-motif cell wall-anchored protein
VITVDASNAGQTHSTTITNKAVEPTPPAPPGPGDGAADGTSDDTGYLSDTGASIAIPAAVGITLLLAGGALLLTVRRRRHS